MEQEGQAVEAVGVRDGKIVFTGTNEEAEKIESDEIIDIKGRAVFPGFIDCHQHTLAYARTTKEVNLVGTKSDGGGKACRAEHGNGGRGKGAYQHAAVSGGVCVGEDRVKEGVL